MDLQLINKGLNFSKRKKKWFLILAAFGVSGYVSYRVYNLPSIVRKRNRVLKLLNTLFLISEVVSDSTETIGIISRDLRLFLQSDCDEIPNSLKQVGKLVNSDEFNDGVIRFTASFTRGVFRGYEVESSGGGGGVRDGNVSGSGFYERFMDKLFSNAGTGFVSVVAGSFARNLVTALYAANASEGDKKGGGFGDGGSWVDVMCNERGRELIGECIQKFVSTAVAVYLDKTMDVNTYDELFAGLTNPKHEKPVREMLVELCNGSIETLVKTSHKVLTNSESGRVDNMRSGSGDLTRFVLTRSDSDVVSKTYYSEIDDACNVVTVKENGIGSSSASEKDRQASSSEGWVSTVSSTLAIPRNRKLVLDVTGRVTFETVRSFLDFLLEKFFATVKRSYGAVNDAIVETGFGVMRYVTAKSYVVVSICLSLCLHLLGGTWALMPA